MNIRRKHSAIITTEEIVKAVRIYIIAATAVKPTLKGDSKLDMPSKPTIQCLNTIIGLYLSAGLSSLTTPLLIPPQSSASPVLHNILVFHIAPGTGWMAQPWEQQADSHYAWGSMRERKKERVPK
ncbi:hypothetical protein An03g05730 [Aspergillus niger]|uniref:Uncharacterized protein n=2 Tax=Aspergillus niger TaxID=5061 RepID=A2QH63_ASPNC|nr:hypothetical protein An03g05730 [Aspergillus niger]CAK38333.1 hypothetical protein An03g05730 [Aspergillus niger]